MKRTGVAANEQFGAPRKRNELLQRRGQWRGSAGP
jgi:hypothetical protein